MRGADAELTDESIVQSAQPILCPHRRIGRTQAGESGHRRLELGGARPEMPATSAIGAPRGRHCRRHPQSTRGAIVIAGGIRNRRVARLSLPAASAIDACRGRHCRQHPQLAPGAAVIAGNIRN
jgi:hypothetical protein